MFVNPSGTGFSGSSSMWDEQMTSEFIFDFGPLRQYIRTTIGSDMKGAPLRDEDCDACLMQGAGMALRGAGHDQLHEYLASCCIAMGVQASDEALDFIARAIAEQTRRARGGG